METDAQKEDKPSDVTAPQENSQASTDTSAAEAAAPAAVAEESKEKVREVFFALCPLSCTSSYWLSHAC